MRQCRVCFLYHVSIEINFLCCELSRLIVNYRESSHGVIVQMRILIHSSFVVVNYEGESISNQPNLFSVEIHLFLFDVMPSSVMHLDQWCSSAISPELKKSGSFPLTHSSTAVTTSSSDRKWSPRISFFKFGNRKKSLGGTSRSGE